MVFTMFRFRRYRVFLICAFLITLLIVRLSRTQEWESALQHGSNGFPSSWQGSKTGLQRGDSDSKRLPLDIEKLAHASVPPSESVVQYVTSPTQSSSQITSPISPTKTVPTLAIPDREPLPPAVLNTEENERLHAVAPKKVEPVDSPETSPIHWGKQKEHFPVPTESIIQLPTGSPVSFPKIQYDFSDETPNDKIKREQRQKMVRTEFQRAWQGYKTQAWMHDELAPITGSHRDPFCGWAATLVDSLDTLWIMGLKEDFEEAVRAVGTIDFTTSIRADIPVFETTIRYLGGLLGAYDVSGGNHRILLDKAVELGEILYGAFDTPNRMPTLFYRWKPAYASQPHRAGTRANMAELGSLSMEFTRLAQLTKQPKYYDAIARITNAFVEWQKRGTGLEGLFPSEIDTSGCNRSEPVVNNQLPPLNPVQIPAASSESKGYQAPMPLANEEPVPLKGIAALKNEDIELSVIPGQPSKGHIQKVEPEVEKHEGTVQKISARSLTRGISNSTLAQSPQIPPASLARQIPDSVIGDWECVPQGLDSATYGNGEFGVGAGQDSTYEYFAKQYLLLGGHEEKYRDLYLNAMKGVRKHMLYRPMAPNDPEILFAGKVFTGGVDAAAEASVKFESEVTHLTCFIGGMVGMGAKIFKLDQDIDIAKQLSQGCVWAYKSMQDGIMPEKAQMLACKSINDCHWNETVWAEAIDPMAGQRDAIIEEYDINKAKLEAQIEADRLAAKSKLAVEEKDEAAAAEAERLEQTATGFGSVENNDASGKPPASPRYEEGSTNNQTTTSFAKSGSLLKNREVAKDVAKPSQHDLRDDEKTLSRQVAAGTGNDQFQKKLESTQLELESAAPGREQKNTTQVPKLAKPVEVIPDPLRPLNHKQYLAERIEQEGLVPGFTRLNDNRYILRPEAIESVWYMYRITGDTKWQEQGWSMFEHIINATTARFGHTAVSFMPGGKPEPLDQMESFWLAETLKYFYLLYSTPDTISLDDWVLNTEAHPFKRPVA